ncbi:hypothetical protein F511_26014 [Dorcoceras hygrometricum]|uniref:Uncharacterized protein n=1 Tax=Dorcoceras hygrometricum TaxID=472368 RepID=A0A2Z7D910_9LAMI|nr:hypothetical protein F511_26014 [Dorcoceras hygrometricum]
MVVDLIGIYGLKGPYCTLTTTNWFLQALSVIPRGSWGDVARRFTMIRWAVLLVQADEGVTFLVVDRIGDIYRNLPKRSDVIITTNRKTKIFGISNLRPPRATAPTCMSERARSRAIGLRTRCARPPTRGRYSTCDCRTSPAKVCVRLARSCALLDAEELRDGRASGRRSMRDDGDAWHWPLVEHVRRTMAHVGRAMRDCAALVARENFGWWRPPLRRVSGDVVTAGLISSRVWFGPVPDSP